MKSIEQQFTYDGFRFRQIARQGDVVLLEKTKPAHRYPSYEIVILQIHPPCTVHGRRYPAREAMPRSTEWGLLGWTESDSDRAFSKFWKVATARAKASSLPTRREAECGRVANEQPTVFRRAGWKRGG